MNEWMNFFYWSCVGRVLRCRWFECLWGDMGGGREHKWYLMYRIVKENIQGRSLWSLLDKAVLYRDIVQNTDEIFCSIKGIVCHLKFPHLCNWCIFHKFESLYNYCHVMSVWRIEKNTFIWKIDFALQAKWKVYPIVYEMAVMFSQDNV